MNNDFNDTKKMFIIDKVLIVICFLLFSIGMVILVSGILDNRNNRKEIEMHNLIDRDIEELVNDINGDIFVGD